MSEKRILEVKEAVEETVKTKINEKVNAGIATAEFLKQIVEKASCGIILIDGISDGNIVFANDYVFSLLDYMSKEEYYKTNGKKVSALIPADEKQRVKALVSRQIYAGGFINIEFRAIKKDGSRLWVKTNISKITINKTTYYACTVVDINYTKVLLDESYKSRKDLDIITNSIPGGVIKLKMDDFSIKYANDGFFRLAGYSRVEYSTIFMNRCDNMIYPDDMDKVKSVVKTAIENKGNIGMEYRIIAKDGSVRWSYANGTRIDDEEGDVVYLFIIMDITSRKKMEYELTQIRDYISQIATNTKETFWIYDVKTKEHTRMGYLENTYSDVGVIYDPFGTVGKDVVHPDDMEKFSKYYNRLITTNEFRELVVRLKNENGLYYPAKISAKGGEDELTGHDIVYGTTKFYDEELTKASKKKSRPTKEESHLIQLAKSARADMKDTLTGLLTYSSFLKKAEKVLSNKEEGMTYAIVCADINEFHRYNQNYGFSRSNELLRNYSKVLKNVLAEEGICTRVDGDYFVILFKYKSHNDLLNAMSRIQDAVEIEKNSGTYINFDTTIGIYIIEDDGKGISEMLENADLARRSIKGIEGSHYAIYSDNIRKGVAAQDDLVSEILTAVDNGGLEIKYLPRIKDDRGNIIGCKAIPSVRLGNGKYVEHDKMIRIMETGLELSDIGLKIINEIATNIGAWRAIGNEVLPVSIVFSSAQLSSPTIVKRINKIIEINDLKTSNFLIEIPEKYFQDTTYGFNMSVKELARSGYKVIISRFGSYNMNISALRTLPLAGIKLHGEYFNDDMRDERDKKMLAKVVEMCDDIGLEVYCGTVNTKLQEKFAKEIGCTMLEGDIIHPAAKPRVFEKIYLNGK